ncbi:MAG: hypothetical protein IT368_11060 [Candidatus Hydrogenedentes bacterium]|nr:hypothetical protein [Candidatus Hydrogenedentota bacterium]
MASVTLLESVARHEESLQQDLLAAQDEARQVVDAAQQAAASHRQQEHYKAEAEVAETRRQAAQRRDELEARIEREADDQVARIRERSTTGRTAARDEVVRMILPAGTEG